MDITVAHRPWPHNARASPVRMRIPARRYRISGELMIEGSAIACRFGSLYKKTARAFSDLVGGLRLSAPEDIVRVLGDLLDGTFIEDAGNRPQGELRDDILPHLLVRDSGEGRLDVRRLLEGHHEAVRELTAHLVRDAGRSLVDEGQDEIELPRLASEAAERVRVRRDFGTQELVGLLEEEDEPRKVLVPLGVQVEQPTGENVRDEEVHHLVRPEVPAIEDDALALPDRREDLVERILAFFRLFQEWETVESSDPTLETLERHLMGPFRSEDLHRCVLHRRDQIAARASFRDFVEGVDHRRREVLEGDDEVLRGDLPRVEDERPCLFVLRIEGEDVHLPGEEVLQALRLVGRAEHAVLAVHVEDEDGSDVFRQDAGAHELVQD